MPEAFNLYACVDHEGQRGKASNMEMSPLLDGRRCITIGKGRAIFRNAKHIIIRLTLVLTLIGRKPAIDATNTIEPPLKIEEKKISDAHWQRF